MWGDLLENLALNGKGVDRDCFKTTHHTNFYQSRECNGLPIPVMDKGLTTFNTKLKVIEESGDT